MAAKLMCAEEERIQNGSSALNHQALTKRKVFSVSLFGGPGCGKTSLLQATLKRLGKRLRIAVILGNLQAEEDAKRLRKYCSCVVPVETIDLTPQLLREALKQVDLSATDLLFIERAAEAPPHPWDLGQDATVGLFSLAGGDDKVRRHPERVEHADLMLLTKIDLLPFVPFDMNRFHDSVRVMNSAVPVLGISVMSGQGMDSWCDWLLGRVEKMHPEDPDSLHDESDYYLG